jgi:hypothetical protein
MVEVLGAGTRQVLLSADTARKQAARHPDLEPEEYRVLPSLFRDGAVIQQDEQRLVFFEAPGERWYKAVVKATGDGQEIYLVSFQRMHSDAGLLRREFRRLLHTGTPLKGDFGWVQD